VVNLAISCDSTMNFGFKEFISHVPASLTKNVLPVDTSSRRKFPTSRSNFSHVKLFFFDYTTSSSLNCPFPHNSNSYLKSIDQ
jgi:hypothetical protein